jgi:stage III sporulation protein AG
MTKFWEKLNIKKLSKNKHIIFALVIVLLCGLVIIFTSTKSSSDNSEKQVTTAASSSSALEYASAVAANLQEMIGAVNGVSNAKVVVVVESSPVIHYLTEESSQEQSAIVYYKQGSNYQPVAVAEFLPKITGILVVAKGVDNLTIKYNLLNAISAVYNLDISSIDILEGK